MALNTVIERTGIALGLGVLMSVLLYFTAHRDISDSMNEAYSVVLNKGALPPSAKEVLALLMEDNMQHIDVYLFAAALKKSCNSNYSYSLPEQNNDYLLAGLINFWMPSALDAATQGT